ncbi:hypothetical protein HY478_00700, partial [Candidatus Uhrbacteria bacterium]|nr:hypothetical protein [Candidatus Uhrbacteria bacterium]
MKTKLTILILPLIVLVFAGLTVLDAQTCQPLFAPAQASWPVAIENQAYDIVLDDNGEPLLQPVATAHPVIFYFGRSLDGCYFAYTPLKSADGTLPSLEAFKADPDPDVYPGASLVVEHIETGEVRTIATGIVDGGRWAPTQPATLAYITRTTFTEHGWGVAVADARSGKSVLLKGENVYPGYVGWHPVRDEVQFYAFTGEKVTVLSPLQEPWERRLLEQESFSLETNSLLMWDADLLSNQRDPNLPTLLPFNPDDLPEPLPSEDRTWEVQLESGGFIQGESLGGRRIEIFSDDGSLLTTTEGYRVLGTLPSGILYRGVNKITGHLEVRYLRSDGRDEILAASSGAATSIFLLPFMGGLTVTQSGEGYTPPCNISSHKGSLAYAYDMVGSTGFKQVIAATRGCVVYFDETVWCNSFDNGPRPGFYDDSTYCDDFAS